MKKIAPAIFLSLVLVGCGPVVGTVVEKDYDQAGWESYTRQERYACGTEVYTTTSNGKTTTKSRTKYCNRSVKDQRWVPDEWDITVEDLDGRQHEIEVSEEVFNSVEIGDKYDSSK